MMKFLAIIFLVLFCVIPASHAAKFNRYPDPMVVTNVTPPLTIPGIVVKDIHDAARQCDKYFGTFNLSLKHIRVLDISEDGRNDYIMSSEAFLCDGKNGIYDTVDGDEYLIYVAKGTDDYIRWPTPRESAFRAYELVVENSFNPPRLEFTVTCNDGKADLYNHGKTTLYWDGNDMRTAGKRIGCGLLGKQRTGPSSVVVQPKGAPAP